MTRARDLSRLANAKTVDTNLNVGIGTTIPKAKLDVAGIVSATAFYGDGTNLTNTGSTLSAASGSQRVVLTNLTSGTMTASSTDADLAYNATTDTLNVPNVSIVGTATTALIVNGNARVTGILTIGTSSVTLDGTNNQVNVGTGVTLHHTNGVQVGGNTVHSTGLTINNVNVTGILTAATFSGNGSGLTGIAGTSISQGNTRVEAIDTGSDGNVRITTEGTERVRVNSSGYVGFGTTNPSTFLHLFGNDIASRGQLSVTGDNSNNARISLYTNNTFIGHLQGGTTDGIKVNTESSYPIIFAPGGNERVRVGSAGSLSVNTSTPQANLHVNGSGSLQSSILNRTGYASNNAEICGYFVTNQGYNGADGVNARVGVYGQATSFNEGGAYGVYGIGGGNVGNGGGVGVYGIAGSTYSSGGATYGVRGYRTRSPSTGNGYGGYFETESSLYSTNAALGIQVNAKTAGDGDSIGAVFNDNNSGTLLACSFRRSGTQVGRIETTASATAYQTSSDYRLKENVVPLTNAIDRLKNIPVRRFNFKVEPEKTVDGFVAHEVQPFVPEAVSGVKDEVKNIYNDNGEIVDTEPVYQGIDQAKLVPLLTAALQEALDKIDALQARLDAAGL